MKSKKIAAKKVCTVRDAETFYLVSKSTAVQIVESNPKVLGALLAKKTLRAVKIA